MKQLALQYWQRGYLWWVQSPRWWLLGTILLALLFLAPLAYVLLQLLESGGDEFWEHIRQYLLGTYVQNSLLLLLGLLLGTVLLGLPAAWVLSIYQFPGRRLFSWLLILPLAIPAYINAYVYKYIFERGILVYTGWRPDLMNLGGAVLVMSSVLFPYVYIVARSSFERQSQTLLEVSQMLGRSAWYGFFRVALPLARPAVSGALLLVMMEGLNEYGTLKYYGVSTFTTGIFRAWFALNSLEAAMKLSAVLVIFVLLMIVLERWQRGRMRFSESHSGGYKALRRIHLKGWGSFWAVLVCFVPLLLGFLLPLIQLVSWSFQAQGAVVSFPVLSHLAFNTFMLALVSAALIVLLALLASYVSRIGRQGVNRLVVQGASLGYAVPGAVIAVGSMAALLALDRSLSALLSFKSGFWISGTLLALVYAYAVRFFAVAVSPVEAGFQKISPCIDDAAAMAGRSRSYALWRVHVPALKGNLVAALILVVVDVMKELPLTLILRPFNFETLSTVAFELADDERVAASALVSILIVAVGVIPVIMLNRLRDRY